MLGMMSGPIRTDKKQRDELGPGCLMLLFSLAVLAGVTMLGIKAPLLLALFGYEEGMAETTGTVVGFRDGADEGEEEEGQSQFIEFETEDGRKLTVEIWCAPFGKCSEPGLGTEQPVLYARTHPEQAIRNRPEDFLAQAGFVLIALAAMVIGIKGVAGSAYIIRQRLGRPAP